MFPVIRKRNSLPGLVDDFLGSDFPSVFFNWGRESSVPAVNILENKDEYRIEVAAPGLKKDDFKIDLDNMILTISSEKEEKKEDQEDRYMCREFSYRSFSRSFSLPGTVSADKISAQHNEGILTVIIPKKEEAKEKPVRQIKIS
jgi:HSP20 family protein